MRKTLMCQIRIQHKIHSTKEPINTKLYYMTIDIYITVTFWKNTINGLFRNHL